ncbi:MAG TPA: zinc ribbon domain-containing protein [Pyrinomonadaceae bacterium]|nr:zinc ribbon domain-containing protein [Pyrinomonadaceae bacterium]
MYCSACGSPITPGLSFCNRCGMSLKERSADSKSSLPVALVTAMVLVAVSAMGLLLGGPIALKREGQFGEELVVLFMFLTFLITAFTEIFLYRQLSRLTAQPKLPTAQPMALPTPTPAEYYAPQPRSLAEPLPSVTENTTRTLEYQRNEPGRKDYS